MNYIKYIGVDDLDIDLFESQYIVPEGMSYNSYLIEDEKIAIMDTADRRKAVSQPISWRITWNLTMLRSLQRCSKHILNCSLSAALRL